MIKRYQGCLIGLAVGDALGAPVEFMNIKQIKNRYGAIGIRDFDRWDGFEAGTYTDDTQMSLATAIGCIRAWERGAERGIRHPASLVYEEYLEWLKSQSIPGQARAPGITCLKALGSGKMGTVEEKINNSKGCGGVMRTAPAGLAFPPGRAFEEGVAFAAITHGHPSGYLPAGVLAEIVARLIRGNQLREAIDASIALLMKYEGCGETVESVEKAISLADSGTAIEKCIQTIGEGWVGEEALAISIYCSLRFSNDWAGGTLAAVNHSGDSDSTGSITGAILGTLLGIEAIPAYWVKNVEDSAKINSIATEMFEKFGNSLS